jgi:hypothetical protein
VSITAVCWRRTSTVSVIAIFWRLPNMLSVEMNILSRFHNISKKIYFPFFNKVYKIIILPIVL